MKGVKIAASVVAIVEGVSAIISGVTLMVIGVLWNLIFGNLLLETYKEIGYGLSWVNVLYIVIFVGLGVFFVILGILSIVFAVKFNVANPENKITVTLLVFSILVGNMPSTILLIIYLVLYGKQQDQNLNL